MFEDGLFFSKWLKIFRIVGFFHVFPPDKDGRPTAESESVLASPPVTTSGLPPAMTMVTTSTSTIPSTGLGTAVSQPSTLLSADESDPRVGWIYSLPKVNLVEEMSKYGLSTKGKVEDLRKVFIPFYRDLILKRNSNSDRGLGDSSLGASKHSERTDSERFSADERSAPSIEASWLREMLELPPGADITSMKRALASLVQGSRVLARSGLPVNDSTNRATDFHMGNSEFSRPENHRLENHSSYEPRTDFSNRSEHNSTSTICNIVRKWGLRFDGLRDPISFLERLEELMESYSLDRTEILRALPELFTGQALLWQRNNRSGWSTYNDFRRDFEVQFWPPGYQRKLDDELRRRTQGEKESFKDFVIALTTLIRRRGGFTEEEKVDLLYNNMRPDYKLTVRRGEVRSVAELIRSSEHYESYLREKANYLPPPNVAQALIAETAYNPKRKTDPRHEAAVVTVKPDDRASSASEHFRKMEPAPRTPTKVRWAETTSPQHQPCYNRERSPERYATRTLSARPNDPKPSEGSMIVCWNCDRRGHLYRHCDKPKVLRCYRCKAEGVRTTECPCRTENFPGARPQGGQASPQVPRDERPPRIGRNGSSQ